MVEVMSELYLENLNEVIQCDLPWEKLKYANVLVTGATGLIGSCIVDVLMQLGNVNVFAMGRSNEKCKKRFYNYLTNSNFKFICHDVSKRLDMNIDFDYIIHAASGSHPTEFNNRPVETMTGNFLGTYNLLEYAKEHKIKRFIYISSGEVYGEARDDVDSVKEDYSGYVNPIKVRSCYPSAKRASETLLISYFSEYGLDSVIARPCHVYGPTMTAEDSRVVAEFIRNAVNGEDIVLRSGGRQIRSYIYVTDAVSAIFYILFLGESSEAYNISNDSVVSIRELAEIISKVSNSNIIYGNDGADVNKVVLNSNRLASLGWKSEVRLEEGIIRTIEILKDTK